MTCELFEDGAAFRCLLGNMSVSVSSVPQHAQAASGFILATKLCSPYMVLTSRLWPVCTSRHNSSAFTAFGFFPIYATKVPVIKFSQEKYQKCYVKTGHLK